MRSVSSRHCESLRQRPRGVWRHHGVPYDTDSNNYRPILNVPQLVETLKQALNPEPGASQSDTGLVNSSRKRRSASALEGSSRKRIKLDSEAQSLVGPDKDDINSESDPFEHWSGYPYIPFSSSYDGLSSPRLGPEDTLSPVFRVLFELRYTTAVPERADIEQYADKELASKFGWVREEHELLDIINTIRGDATEPINIDLGRFPVARYCGRLLVLTEKVIDITDRSDIPDESKKWFFLLPPLPWEEDVDLGEYDYADSEYHRDILAACCLLQSNSRAKLDFSLRVVVLPDVGCDESELPFRLQMDITVSMILPSIFRPIKLEDSEANVQRRFLSYIFPIESPLPTSVERRINIPFFYSILCPAPHIPPQISDSIQPEDLLPTLLPFQRRSVAWMLKREGRMITDSGSVAPIPNMVQPPILFWDRVEAEGSQPLYINRLTGNLCAETPVGEIPFGGILAEEPGLGKTIECMALILLNPAPQRNPSNFRWDPVAKLKVKEVKTTLIVTPASLATQWADEFARHAPSLKVLVYDGYAKSKSRETIKALSSTSQKSGNNRIPNAGDQKDSGIMDIDEDEDYPENAFDWCSYIDSFDVCITTFPVLRADLDIARAPVSRPRRSHASYLQKERKRSPLVMCEWYRVIMDEVQMQGGGKTEEMVSLIPRLSSFAVSGTPARAQVNDLMRVLKFLRVDGLIGRHPRLWKRLLKSGFAEQFRDLFGRFAIRAVKAAVKDELTIPEQTRYLVDVELGPVERHVYERSLDSALLELGLDARGVATSPQWQVDAGLLRTLLRRLRGICTHPQVGQLSRQGDKYKPNALKTMSDVLEAMKDQNWRNLMEDRKAKVQATIKRAQLLQHAESNTNRYHEVLDALLLSEKEANQIIEDVKTAIKEHEKSRSRIFPELISEEESPVAESTNEERLQDNDTGKGKEKSMENSKAPSVAPSESDDFEETEIPKTPAGEEFTNKRRGLQQRLRDCYLILHRVKFLQGDIYHVLGDLHSADEESAYAAAGDIRLSLLKTTEKGAIRAMTLMTQNAASKGLTADSFQIATPYCGEGGEQSADLMDEANNLIEDVLNAQSALLWKWRECMHTLLTQSLSAGDNEADGQEYARTLETQGEAEAYLQAFASLLADRREVLTAERTLLAAHDTREKTVRVTKAALAAAATATALRGEVLPEYIAAPSLEPEHEVLHTELTIVRKQLITQANGRAIKSVMVDLTVVAAGIANDNSPEKIMAKEGATRLRQLISSQTSLVDKLEADLALFRKAFNERILYFRQLQEISDSVAEVTWENSLVDEIQTCETEENDLSAKIQTNKARHRYLEHLARHKTDGDANEDDETCILCRCEFKRGFITQCAHVFCEACMKAWLMRKEGRGCPVCRVIIKTDQLQRFTVREKEVEQVSAPVPSHKPDSIEPMPQSLREIEYNTVAPRLRDEIDAIESHGSYGSKIQTLVRHLLYLKTTDPGAKSIVFSAWADSLHIVEHALMRNGIQCIRIDQTKGKHNAANKFRTDPNILVFLLHGERENAGLNVTCASRVFLLESVVHHGFEIQAIARIDRMGQQRSTEVFCYYAKDTVEKNILDLAAKQGLSLYTRDNCRGTLNVTSFAVDSAKSVDSPNKKKIQKGDFIYKTDDMLAILFPHMFEDIEYLLPSQDLGITIDETSFTGSAHHVNAIAGPSRLPI